MDVSWTVEEGTIEEILIAKYLGVQIQFKDRSIIGKQEEIIVRRATNYTYSIMNLCPRHLFPWNIGGTSPPLENLGAQEERAAAPSNPFILIFKKRLK